MQVGEIRFGCTGWSASGEMAKSTFSPTPKRPGHMTGPYDDMQAFITEYEQYRGRRSWLFGNWTRSKSSGGLKPKATEPEEPYRGTEPIR